MNHTQVQRHGVEDRAYLRVSFINDFMCDSMMCDILVFQAALFRIGIDEYTTTVLNV